MTTNVQAPRREQQITDQMLVELETRVPNVEISHGPHGWTCMLSGHGWQSRYRASSRFEAVLAAHSTFYWPS